jgi:hypothetical protein
MKTEPLKNRKQRQTANVKKKPACGTLNYLAECRGTQQKTAPGKREKPSIIGRIAYKKPPSLS